jgi:hypothetical protein
MFSNNGTDCSEVSPQAEASLQTIRARDGRPDVATALSEGAPPHSLTESLKPKNHRISPTSASASASASGLNTRLPVNLRHKCHPLFIPVILKVW